MEWLIGVIAGIGAVLVIALLYRNKNKSNEEHFDEMQLKLRGDGYKVGFLTVLVCAIVYAIVDEFNSITIFSTGFALFIIVFIGITVFSVFCIVKEAFFSVGNNGRRYLILSLIIAGCNGFAAIASIMDGSILDNGLVTFSSGGNLLCGCAFAVISVTLIVKLFVRRDEDEES